MPKIFDNILLKYSQYRYDSAKTAYDQFLQKHIDNQIECFKQIHREYSDGPSKILQSKPFTLDNIETFAASYKLLYNNLEKKYTEADGLKGYDDHLRYEKKKNKEGNYDPPKITSLHAIEELYRDLGNSTLKATEKATMIGELDKMVESNFIKRETKGILGAFTKSIETFKSNAVDFITKNKAFSLCLIALATCVAAAVVIATGGLAAPGIALMFTSVAVVSGGVAAAFIKLEKKVINESNSNFGKLVETPEYMVQQKMKDAIKEMRDRPNPSKNFEEKTKTVNSPSQSN